MHLETILNRCYKLKGFVYAQAQRKLHSNGEAIIAVLLRPHKKSKPCCSICQQPGPRYDRLKPRKFRVIPLWGFRVMFVYTRRRLTCPVHGVQAE